MNKKIYKHKLKEYCAYCCKISWKNASMIICKNSQHHQVLQPDLNGWGFEIDPWEINLVNKLQYEKKRKKQKS